ncbi:hypothetical protein [Flavobacterium sp. HJSW_4]|uniref:hypothetical protein n=1 Tax=Flavobacterium sp. HJSW_4 TaxID=3344660 RepID=UPI0035F4D752
MKKQSKTTTVYRIDQEKGNYTTISRNILISTELTDSAKTLLQLCLNNTSEWKLVLSHYRKVLHWSNDKMSNAVSNLIEFGYLKKEKLPNGKGKGFTYIYIVSEFGNLNPNHEKISKEEITQSLTSIESSDDEAIIIGHETQIEATVVSTSAMTDLEYNAINEIIVKAIDGHHVTDDYIAKLSDFYIYKFKSGALTISKLNKENEISSIKRSIEKNFNSKMKVIEGWIDFHNNRGTKDQRSNIKQRALRHFNELEFPLDEVIERDVSTKILKLKSSIVDANRVYDSRYQD